MAEVDFVPFAFDPAANVLDLPDYINVSVSTWRQLGFQTGTALSPNLNRVWRQASLIASMVAQFASVETGNDMIDDGSTTGQANLLSTFTAAVKAVGGSGFTGAYLPLAGGSLTGPLTITGQANALTINAGTGQTASIVMNSQPGAVAFLLGQSNATARWLLELVDGTPQGGANQGGNFALYRYTDAGVLIDSPLSIARNSGIANFNTTPTVAGGPMPFLPITGGTLSGPMSVGGTGISYAVAPEGAAHRIGFGWNGSAAELMVDGTNQGLLATEGYVGAVAGAYLPLAGGTLTGSLTVDGNLYVAGSAQFNYIGFGNIVAFAAFSDSTNNYLQWQSGWYDYFSRTTGTRAWVGNSSWAMTLDGSGNLTTPGFMWSSNGRVISSGGQPSVTMTIGTFAAGFWVGGDGLWFGQLDGSGNPFSGHIRMQTGGVLEVWPASYFYSNLDCSTTVYAANFIESGVELVTTNNDGRVRAMGMSGGSLAWVDSDGSGWLANTYRSDPIFKKNIREADDFDSLGAISRLPIRAFDWRDERFGTHVANGFVSTDLRAVGMTDAVRRYPWKDGQDADHLDILPIIAHLCRAVRQLNAKLEGLR